MIEVLQTHGDPPLVFWFGLDHFVQSVSHIFAIPSDAHSLPPAVRHDRSVTAHLRELLGDPPKAGTRASLLVAPHLTTRSLRARKLLVDLFTGRIALFNSGVKAAGTLQIPPPSRSWWMPKSRFLPGAIDLRAMASNLIASLLLVAMPGAPSSVLAPNSVQAKISLQVLDLVSKIQRGISTRSYRPKSLRYSLLLSFLCGRL